MRTRSALPVRCLALGLAVAALGCKSQPAPQPKPPALTSAQLALAESELEPLPPPSSSATVALARELQASKLRPPARPGHAPQLAFGKDAFGQLTHDSLRLFDSQTFDLLAAAPLTRPRALLVLADGALLAIGAEQLLRWEPGSKKPQSLPPPLLLPGAEVYADAQASDLIWVFDPGASASSHPTLSSYRLAKGEDTVALPEQTIELSSPRGGVFGASREGVWLYVTPGSVERFSPGGLRLGALTLNDGTLPPTWVLPARRLDQALWLDEDGRLLRVLVSPSFKRLAGARLAGSAFVAGVGDEGRLLAVVAVTGEGPRFELELFNNDLEQLASVVLPSDPPTGTEDWIKVVTENQRVAVAAREPRVAVGGPRRVTIFDGRGKQLFSIPSK